MLEFHVLNRDEVEMLSLTAFETTTHRYRLEKGLNRLSKQGWIFKGISDMDEYIFCREKNVENSESETKI